MNELKVVIPLKRFLLIEENGNDARDIHVSGPEKVRKFPTPPGTMDDARISASQHLFGLLFGRFQNRRGKKRMAGQMAAARFQPVKNSILPKLKTCLS